MLSQFRLPPAPKAYGQEPNALGNMPMMPPAISGQESAARQDRAFGPPTQLQFQPIPGVEEAVPGVNVPIPDRSASVRNIPGIFQFLQMNDASGATQQMIDFQDQSIMQYGPNAPGPFNIPYGENHGAIWDPEELDETYKQIENEMNRPIAGQPMPQDRIFAASLGLSNFRKAAQRR